MYPVMGKCPVCGEQMIVTRLYCRTCDSTVEGHFSLGKLYQLNAEQLAFVETFIRCEGKLNRVEQELGISYPTVRSRLSEIIRALGYDVDDSKTEVSAEKRRAVLERLSQGEISYEQAMALLKNA